jgi:cyclophilin family peptidyl-prolyl cis-trans isomerase
MLRWRALGGILSVVVVCLAGCGSGAATPTASIEGETPKQETAAPTDGPALNSAPTKTARPPAPKVDPEVIITTSQGEIRIRLNGEKAPVTVDNFLANYVRRGFYDGTIVHYVAKDSMLAAGGFTTELEAKEARAPILNEATIKLSNKRGTIAMARDPAFAQSATSQFFINLVDNPNLDHKGIESSEDYGYCVFGEVIAGMEVVDAIAAAQVHDQGDFLSTPVQPIVIEKIEQVK